MASLVFDELVQRLRAQGGGAPALPDLEFDCAQCGAGHSGMFDLSVHAPAAWMAATSAQREAFQLHSDLCRNNATGDCFVRGVLPLPIKDSDAVFCFGVWSSLSAPNFQTYLKTFDSDEDGLGPWFGWFSNGLKAYPPTLNLRISVHPQPNGKRPAFELEPCDHPLAVEQREGIDIDRVLDIYAANGHGPLAEDERREDGKRWWWPFG